MEIYRWNNSISSSFVDSILKEVRLEALEYERIIACWLEPDDASMDDLYFTDVWPRIHFAFAAGHRHNFALHVKKWDFVRLRDDTTLTVQNISHLRYITSSMSFCTLVFNRSMRRVTHCTSLEVLALSGRRLSCEAQRVVIDEQHVVHLDLSSGGNVLNLGATFAGLLDRFCGRSIVHSDVVMMREYLSFWNYDVAECSRYTDQLPTGYNVIYDYRSLSASSAPVTSVLVPSSQSSSSSALPVPTPPPAPQLQLAALVPFDGGRHLCPTHEPRNTAKKSDLKILVLQSSGTRLYSVCRVLRSQSPH